MRIGIGGSDGDEGPRYIGELPRSESYRISETKGGFIRDCMVKIAQGGWIFILTAVGLAGGILTLWSLPSWLWFVIIATAYAVVVLVVPALALLAMVERREAWHGYAAVAVATAGVAWAAWTGFEQFLWEPLDTWTRGFFYFEIPVLNGWGLLAGMFFVTSVLAVLLKTPGVAILTFIGVGGSCALWLTTTEFVIPGPMFYVLLAAVDVAYGLAAFGIQPGGLQIRGTVGVLQWEQEDKYRPTIGGEESEAPPPEVQTHHSFIRQRTMPRGDTEEAPQPQALMPTIDSRKPKDNRKNSEWVRTKLPIDEFCEALGHAAVKGLGRREMHFTFRCTGREVKQWNQWVELVEPLVQAGVYNRESGTIHPDFDHGGYIDPWEVLEALSLTQYERFIP